MHFQLKVGYGAIGFYLAKIKMVETSHYWWCGQAEQTVEYLYTKCQQWRKKR